MRLEGPAPSPARLRLESPAPSPECLEPWLPDRVALTAWLSSLPGPAGLVPSWVNADHPGFDYPEAAALWLSWAARSPRGGAAQAPDRRAVAVAHGLACLLARDGGVGRDGALYLFDSALAVDALVRQGADVSSWMPRSIDGLHRFLDEGSPVLPAPPDPLRWSQAWGPHLLRSAALLVRAGLAAASEPLVQIGRLVARRTRPPGPWPAYVHAFAYAAEGEALLRVLGEPPGWLDPAEAADALLRWQRPDGGLPAWADGSGRSRADSTAQAVRIWASVGMPGSSGAMAAALAFLRWVQSRSGGIRYEPGSGDVNVWASIFADQAAAWAVSGPRPDEWI